MRFVADMGVSWRVVDWLRANGHDAIHLREQHLQRLSNGGIFLKAVDEQRVILTWDLDFTEIVALSATRLVSAVVFRLLNTRSENVIRRLARVLSESARTSKKVRLSLWKRVAIECDCSPWVVSANPRLMGGLVSQSGLRK